MNNMKYYIRKKFEIMKVLLFGFYSKFQLILLILNFFTLETFCLYFTI